MIIKLLKTCYRRILRLKFGEEGVDLENVLKKKFVEIKRWIEVFSDGQHSWDASGRACPSPKTWHSHHVTPGGKECWDYVNNISKRRDTPCKIVDKFNTGYNTPSEAVRAFKSSLGRTVLLCQWCHGHTHNVNWWKPMQGVHCKKVTLGKKGVGKGRGGKRRNREG